MSLVISLLQTVSLSLSRYIPIVYPGSSLLMTVTPGESVEYTAQGIFFCIHYFKMICGAMADMQPGCCACVSGIVCIRKRVCVSGPLWNLGVCFSHDKVEKNSHTDDSGKITSRVYMRPEKHTLPRLLQRRNS